MIGRKLLAQTAAFKALHPCFTKLYYNLRKIGLYRSLLCLAGVAIPQLKPLRVQTIYLTIVFVFGCPRVLVLTKEKPVFCAVVT